MRGPRAAARRDVRGGAARRAAHPDALVRDRLLNDERQQVRHPGGHLLLREVAEAREAVPRRGGVRLARDDERRAATDLQACKTARPWREAAGDTQGDPAPILGQPPSEASGRPTDRAARRTLGSQPAEAASSGSLRAARPLGGLQTGGHRANALQLAKGPPLQRPGLPCFQAIGVHSGWVKKRRQDAAADQLARAAQPRAVARAVQTAPGCGSGRSIARG